MRAAARPPGRGGGACCRPQRCPPLPPPPLPLLFLLLAALLLAAPQEAAAALDVDDAIDAALLPTLLAAMSGGATERPRTPGGSGALALRMEALERASEGSWAGLRTRATGSGSGVAATLRSGLLLPRDAAGEIFFFAAATAAATDFRLAPLAKTSGRSLYVGNPFRPAVVSGGGFAANGSTFVAPLRGVYSFTCAAAEASNPASGTSVWLSTGPTATPPLGFGAGSLQQAPAVSGGLGAWGTVYLDAGGLAECWVSSTRDLSSAGSISRTRSFFAGAWGSGALRWLGLASGCARPC